jgi:hypothetical protein
MNAVARLVRGCAFACKGEAVEQVVPEETEPAWEAVLPASQLWLLPLSVSFRCGMLWAGTPEITSWRRRCRRCLRGSASRKVLRQVLQRQTLPMHNHQPLACRNEQDVRERIIYPLLTRLGYTPDMVTTELTLKYEWLFLGHKKGTKKDRP